MDNAQIILATPENGIGSDKSCGSARINVRKHAAKNGYRQYYTSGPETVYNRKSVKSIQKIGVFVWTMT